MLLMYEYTLQCDFYICFITLHAAYSEQMNWFKLALSKADLCEHIKNKKNVYLTYFCSSYTAEVLNSNTAYC